MGFPVDLLLGKGMILTTSMYIAFDLFWRISGRVLAVGLCIFFACRWIETVV